MQCGFRPHCFAVVEQEPNSLRIGISEHTTEHTVRTGFQINPTKQSASNHQKVRRVEAVPLHPFVSARSNFDAHQAACALQKECNEYASTLKWATTTTGAKDSR